MKKLIIYIMNIFKIKKDKNLEELKPLKTQMSAHPCYNSVPKDPTKLDCRCGEGQTFNNWIHYIRYEVEEKHWIIVDNNNNIIKPIKQC